MQWDDYVIYHFNILHLPCINQVHNIQMRFLGYVYIIIYCNLIVGLQL